MRPIRKGSTPNTNGFEPYEKAKPDLVGRLGLYCSYCERYIATSIAVEHIVPKGGLFGAPQLISEWSNFLLACTNCNSCKGSKQVVLGEMLFPDRDNTFCAFEYCKDGTVRPSTAITPHQQQLARNTLEITGLDKPIQNFRDSNDKLVSLDRKSQRMNAFLEALEALNAYEKHPTLGMRQIIISLAKSKGFFSIWMNVFSAHNEIKRALIQEYPGTDASGCFDLQSSSTLSPAPNPDGLEYGGKV